MLDIDAASSSAAPNPSDRVNLPSTMETSSGATIAGFRMRHREHRAGRSCAAALAFAHARRHAAIRLHSASVMSVAKRG